jgi:ABC-type multidrug transport system fused ATPase/permease subunit
MNLFKFLVSDFISSNHKLVLKILLFTIITFTADFILAPKYLSSIINKLNTNNFKDINIVFYKLLLMYFIRIFFSHMLKLSENVFYPKFVQEIRGNLYSKIIEKYSEDYKDLKLGNIYSRITNISTDFRHFLKIITTRIFPLFLINLFIAFLFLSYDRNLGLVMLISVISNLLVLNYFYPTILQHRKITEGMFYDITDNMNNKFSNLMNIYINSQQKNEKTSINNDQIAYKEAYVKATNIQIHLGTGMSIIGTVGVFVIIFMFIKKMYNYKIDDESRIYLLFLLTFYLRNWFKLSRDIPLGLHFLGTVNASQKFLKDILFFKSKNNHFEFKKNDIKFVNINFGYDDNQPVIKNINLNIKSGEKIALIGRSGSGKSTLMKLLIRLYPYKGQILIDDRDIKNIHIDSIRKQISYINQKTHLNDTSILNNIKYGNNVTDLEIKQFLDKYDLNIIFSKLKNGIHSNSGVNGNNLSLGMQKIIILMRGLLRSKESKIIIFDEPLAGLDIHTRDKVMKILKNLDKTKTIIIISHNKEILPFVDRTIDINKISK